MCVCVGVWVGARSLNMTYEQTDAIVAAGQPCVYIRCGSKFMLMFCFTIQTSQLSPPPC